MKKTHLLKALFLIGILTISLLPNRIYANTWSDHFVGYTLSNQKNVITYTFDTHVLGSFVSTITYKTSANGAQQQLRTNIRINGTQVSYVIYNDWCYDVSSEIYTSSLQVVSEMDLTEVIQYLSEIYDNQGDIIDQLNLIYGDTQEMKMIKQYDIFYESYAVLFDMLKTYEPLSIDSTGYYSYKNYPLFNIKTDDQVYKLYCNNGLVYSFVFYSSTPINASNISNLHIIKQGGSDSYTLVRRITIVEGNLNTYRIDFSVPSTGNYVISFGFDIDYFSPIYCYRRDYEYLSTDFCLLYGFSNQIINDLHVIAQGTNQSQTSVSAADQQNATFSDQASDLVDAEDQMIDNFENALQNVQPNITPSDFGSNFLHSAEWVRDQYNNLVNDTPFASLITFSLVLGVGLLIIGRVLK